MTEGSLGPMIDIMVTGLVSPPERDIMFRMITLTTIMLRMLMLEVHFVSLV